MKSIGTYAAPEKEYRNKTQLNTSEDFFDTELGWVKRIPVPCPKCRSENTMVLFEDQKITGCTNCLFADALDGAVFVAGGYTEARKILDTIFDEKRVDKPVQYRFMPMFFKRN